jgi:hypothetical protein
LGFEINNIFLLGETIPVVLEIQASVDAFHRSFTIGYLGSIIIGYGYTKNNMKCNKKNIIL